jgi:predicted nicotinamide N-methyase
MSSHNNSNHEDDESTHENTNTNYNNNPQPLPLLKLKKWVSSDATYKWLEKDDEETEKLKQEMEDGGAFSSIGLFETAEDVEETENATLRRINRWSTSSTNVDGIFPDEEKIGDDNNEDEEDDAIHVIYILSDVLAGFGNVVWSSSRYIANVLANADQCREILAPLISHIDNDNNDDDNNTGAELRHPLLGLSVIELGAGAGIPSWTAMCCGARIISTDQAAPDRIRCMAECVERNWQNISTKYNNNDDQSNNTTILKYAAKVKACPYDWGKPIDEVVHALNPSNSEERFDLIVAADCCYMPWLHLDLLDSIHMLMSDRGVALVPFALHGNTDDDDVWKIVDRAKEKGFHVETLNSQQLAPPNSDMEDKQGLVHTIRLTRPNN